MLTEMIGVPSVLLVCSLDVPAVGRHNDETDDENSDAMAMWIYCGICYKGFGICYGICYKESGIYCGIC